MHWAMVIFALGFSALILMVTHFYLFPAMQAAQGASVVEKASLRAHSSLLLAVMLFILLVGLLLVYRTGKWFRGQQAEQKRIKTEYVDAWAEAGRRMKAPPPDDENEAQ